MVSQEILVVVGVLRHILRHTEQQTVLLEKRLMWKLIILVACEATAWTDQKRSLPWAYTECKYNLS